MACSSSRSFLPRDAMHPRYYSHGPVYVCVCPSVTSRCSIETVERIELVFSMWASFHPSYTVLKENSVISKNKVTSLWNFVLNSGLRKFRHNISIVETCYQLSSKKVDAQSVINWAVIGQPESIIPPSSDARPLFIAQIVKRCLQHDFVARVN